MTITLTIDGDAEASLAEMEAMSGKGISEILPQLFRDAVERMRREREKDLERRRKLIDEICARAAAKIPPNAPSTKSSATMRMACRRDPRCLGLRPDR